MENCKHCGQPISYCSWDNTGEWYHVDYYDFPTACADPWDSVAEPAN